jgi:hypothetical protein
MRKARTLLLTSGIAWRNSSMRLDQDFQVTSIGGDPKACSHAGHVNQRLGRHGEGKVSTWKLPRALICIHDGVIVGAICCDCLSEQLTGF